MWIAFRSPFRLFALAALGLFGVFLLVASPRQAGAWGMNDLKDAANTAKEGAADVQSVRASNQSGIQKATTLGKDANDLAKKTWKGGVPPTLKGITQRSPTANPAPAAPAVKPAAVAATAPAPAAKPAPAVKAPAAEEDEGD